MSSSTSKPKQPPARCFAPVVDHQVRVLILGSLPGRASLAAARYYAHPRNQFWQLIGAVLQEDLVRLDYEARLVRLLGRHIGLWDSIAQAGRVGSLDQNIQDAVPNDLAALVRQLPHLKLIGFNGQKAAQVGHRMLNTLYPPPPSCILPSSSPAHSLALASKTARWIDALAPVL